MNLSNNVKIQIMPMYLHKAQNPRACHIYSAEILFHVGENIEIYRNRRLHRIRSNKYPSPWVRPLSGTQIRILSWRRHSWPGE